MHKDNYSILLLIILKCSVIVYTLYMITVLFINIFLKETSGEIILYDKYIEKVIDKSTRFEGGLINKGYTVRNIWKIDLYYNYTVDGITYSNSRISNVLIFPNIEFIKGNAITVYYNKLIPKYSLVYKCDYLYFILNLLPIITLCIIIFLIYNIKGRYMRNDARKNLRITKDIIFYIRLNHQKRLKKTFDDSRKNILY
jgi:hypothetical protein